MLKRAHIPGYLTTSEAAIASELTAHQIGCLARAGEIDAFKSGNTLFVDAVSLRMYAQTNQGRGRPMTPPMAFAALWMLSGIEPDWLTYAQARRLRLRLESVSAETLLWQLRKRAETRRYRASDSFLRPIGETVVLSGLSSSRLDEFELVQTESSVEGYYLGGGIEELAEAYCLADDTRGNVIIHTSTWLPDNVLQEMPIAVAAADLAQSLEARKSEAGTQMLRSLLDEYRCV